MPGAEPRRHPARHGRRLRLAAYRSLPLALTRYPMLADVHQRSGRLAIYRLDASIVMPINVRPAHNLRCVGKDSPKVPGHLPHHRPGSSIPIGIAWRMAPLHLPPFLQVQVRRFRTVGGDGLLAGRRPLCRGFNPVRVAGVAAVIAALVECSRLIHTRPLDAFRITLAGKLTLGRFFSGKDIVAYWLAIFACAVVDRWVLSKRMHV